MLGLGMTTMQKIRVLLLLCLLPLAPTLGKRGYVGWRAVQGVWAQGQLSPRDADLRAATQAVRPLCVPVGEPQAGDWRATVIQPAQSFAQYVLSQPVQPTIERNTIYVVPLGEFSAEQWRIVDLSVEFLGLYFDCPTQLLPAVGADLVPNHARRIHPGHGEEQFCSAWVHGQFLQGRLPADAAVCIALTATDLWPGGNTNFVFGQASLKDRTGVWSMARYGDPSINEAGFVECLRRTLKTASHETGHMFSMEHCEFYECNMSGSGSLAESDRYPLSLCPECLAKLQYSLQPDMRARFAALADFCEREGLMNEADYYRTALRLTEPSAEE